MIYRICFFLFLCTFVSAGELELTAGATYRDYDEDEEPADYGLGVRGRYSRFSASGPGWFLRMHFEEHILTPAIIPGVAWRWGKTHFVEAGAGLAIELLSGRGLFPAALPAYGYRFNANFYVIVTLYLDPERVEMQPFIGYKF